MNSNSKIKVCERLKTETYEEENKKHDMKIKNQTKKYTYLNRLRMLPNCRRIQERKRKILFFLTHYF